MPRANRYILPGCLYHLTHRCHDRKFLVRFAVTREEYRRRLRAALTEFQVALFGQREVAWDRDFLPRSTWRAQRGIWVKKKRE